MASKNRHEIVQVFQHKEYDTRWHVDRNGTIIRTIGPRDGQGKIVMIRTTVSGEDQGRELIYCGLIKVEPGRHTTRRAKINDPVIQAKLRESFELITT